MTEESDARKERLEKASQDQQGQLAKLIELLKTLVRDKVQAAGQQNSVVQLEHRREDPAYPQGLLPHIRKHNLCLKWEDSHTVMHFPRHRHTK